MVSPMDTSIEGLIERLPVVALVLAAKDIELDAEPEEGIAGEVAAAKDALVDAEKKAQGAARTAEKLGIAIEEKNEDETA